MADMIVSVRLFAILRERAGATTIEIELPEPATVDDALKALAQRSELAEVLARVPVRMAINREYAEPSSELHRDDELALITPVSGGAETRVHARISNELLQEVSGLVARPVRGRSSPSRERHETSSSSTARPVVRWPSRVSAGS
jgi:molybdopterin converting factor small subunit